jgi:hypothetical protein
MEYFVGSIITLLTMIVVGKVFIPKITNKVIPPIRYGQSHLYEIIKNFIPRDIFSLIKKENTQSFNYLKENGIRVFFTEREAYMIKNGKFVVAEFDGKTINMDSIKPVDIMGMDKVELDKMIFIIDKLTEGKTNDSGNSRN